MKTKYITPVEYPDGKYDLMVGRSSPAEDRFLYIPVPKFVARWFM